MAEFISEADEKHIIDVLQKRRSVVDNLVEVADSVCKKMEHPTASVTIIDQENLRRAIDAVKSQTFLGS